MRKFSKQSQDKLDQCHPDLKRLFERVIQIVDCTVVTGFRNEKDQNEAFRTGKSKLKWPQSKHNKRPSLAVDVIPWPVDWKDYNRFYFFMGVVKGVAAEMGIKVRCGGDWDGDNDFKDQTFIDLPHFEIEG